MSLPSEPVERIASLINATRHWRGSSTDVWFHIALPDGKRQLDLGTTNYVDEFYRSGIDGVIANRKWEIAQQLVALAPLLDDY